jgi:hypothetical protein
MGSKLDKKGDRMGSKPRPLGYNAMQKIDEAQMAVTQSLYHASAVMTNDLTREGIYKAVGLVLKEAAEAQKVLTEIKYLGK